MFFEKNNQKGSSLVEVLGVISVISILGIATLKLVTNSLGVFKQSMATTEIKELQEIISKNYAFSGKYDEIDANINKKICEDDKTAPNHMCIKSGSDYVLKHRLSGNINIEKIDDKSYFIEFDNIGKKACIALSQIDWLERKKISIYQIDINNTPVAYYPKKNNKGFPISSSTSISGCKNETNVIKWYFY